jgi:hypothetical protein
MCLRRAVFVIALLVLVTAAPSVAAAQPPAAGQILIDFYVSAPNTGFADPTPADPVGDNPGVTVGQQRIFVFLRAAQIWTEVLKPDQNIFVAAIFTPLPPGVLGAAGPSFIHADFPRAELANTWYYDALADKLAGQDLSPTTYDIEALFSSTFDFYRGFDNNEGPTQADLLVTVLHELGHGLNFGNAVDDATGEIPIPEGEPGPFGDIYSQFTMDVTTGKTWNAMTAAERAASTLNVRHVSWSGLHVKSDQYRVLERGEPIVRVLSPPVASPLMLGEAAFGPALTGSGIAGQVVLVQNAIPTGVGSDGCTTILNDVAGRIALIDRGTCTFAIKVKNAQDAGAIAVLIADNVLSLPPPGLAGADPTIVIPSGRIGLSDATAIKASLASGVRVRMLRDRTVVAGTDRIRRQVMVAAFNPVQPGSSISHFDAVARPNQIMEPAINGDLVSSVRPPRDLSTSLLTDLGWFTDRDGVQDGVDFCLGSNIAPTVVVGSCDSGATNTVLTSGCSVADIVNACEGVPPGFLYRACVILATGVLRHQGAISGSQQSAINSCVLRP